MNQPFRWDDDEAAKLVGKTILIGVTYLDHNHTETARKQWFGTIAGASQEEGIVVAIKDDPTHCALPPDLNAIRRAKPGYYQLESTDEIIEDPDYLTTWTRVSPPPVQ